MVLFGGTSMLLYLLFMEEQLSTAGARVVFLYPIIKGTAMLLPGDRCPFIFQ
jgi:hypothetical protein